jgi:hypothetical protein
MQWGSVAILDILGFKGIWKRVDPDLVLKQMNALKAGFLILTSRLEDLASLPMRLADFTVMNEDEQRQTREKYEAFIPTYQIRMFSDSVIVAAHLPPRPNSMNPPGIPEYFAHQDEHFRQWYFLRSVIILVTSLVTEAIRLPVPFLYRGCIACGEFKIDHDFLVGPAIDEAAELHEQAEASIVWLAPSAAKVYGGSVVSLVEVKTGRSTQTYLAPQLTRYEIPLKQGSRAETYALSLLPVLSDSERVEVASKILAAFDLPGAETRPDVQLKKQNTKDFLDHVLHEQGMPSEMR